MTDAVVQNGARTDRTSDGAIPWMFPVEYNAIRQLSWKVDILARLQHVRADVRQALSAAGWTVTETNIDITVADGSPNPASADIQQRQAAEEVVREIGAAVTDAALAIMPSGPSRKSPAAGNAADPGQNAAVPALAARPRGSFRRLRDRMTGGTLLSAYVSLHAAEAAAVRLLSAPQLQARLPLIRERVTSYLPKDDSRRVALGGVPDLTGPVNQSPARPSGPAPAPVTLTPMLGEDQLIASEALTGANRTEDRQQWEVKRFRGLLVLTFAALVLVIAAVGILGSFRPAYFPLCGTASTHFCPNGGSSPGVIDIWLIMGLGMLGALLSGVIALSQSKPGGVHYSLSAVQALNKVGLGALTAVLGIIVLRTLLSSHSTVLSGQPELLAAAAAFGYSQQLFTGLMDKKASGLQDAASPQTPAQPSPVG